MLSYSIKQILTLAPEAYGLVKQAKLEEEFPIDSRDSCVASALRVEYQKHFTGELIDPDVMEKVAMAVDAYGASEDVARIKDLMLRTNLEKTASENGFEQLLMKKQASFEEALHGWQRDPSQASHAAQGIHNMCVNGLLVEPSEEVKRYSGNKPLVKEAALQALNNRFEATGNAAFVKLAAAMSPMPDVVAPSDLTKQLCKTVTMMDKSAGLDRLGFDFYKEALAAGSGVTRVKVGNQEFPLEAIMRIPSHHLTSYLGADIGKELSGADPMTAKAVVESLPADMQQMLLRMLKNC